MDKIKAQLAESTAILDPYGANIPPVVDLAKKLDVNTGLIVGVVLLVLSIIFMIVEGWTIFITLLTVIYPSLRSVKAIESKEEGDDKIWLTYWIIFGFFTVLEQFFGLFLAYIPYWNWLRLAFFCFLILPQFNGAKIVYEKVMKE